MTCREYEPLIALYVEGDLDDAAVERHVTECAACRELLEDLRASQAALKEFALDPVDPALLIGVRSGVLARIGERRGIAWPLRWISVAALAAGAALLVLQSPAPTVKREPLVVKMLTSDPDVVIIWLVDQTGD
jgi:anti-sigma factor RsiW